jgi:hypothetical protein
MLNGAVPGRRRAGRILLATVLGSTTAAAQNPGTTPDPRERLDQDELTSFYGRGNIVLGSGARALGMGGAFLARADDATAASWNPAGLSYLRRTEASIVGVSNRFEQDVSRVIVRNNVTVRQTGLDTLRATGADFGSFAYPVRIRERLGAVQVAYQRVFSFSGERSFEGFAAFPGVMPRENPFTTVANGGFDTLSLAAGFQVHSKARVGFALNRWIGGFSQTVDRFPAEPPDPDFPGLSIVERTISSDWTLRGTNANLGLILTPIPELNVGIVYKSSLKGDLRLYKTRVDKDLGTAPVDNFYGTEHARLKLPRVRGIGLAYNASSRLTLSADVTETQWSAATIQGFFTLRGGAGEAPDTYASPLPFPATEAQRQADSRQIRVGVEWIWTPSSQAGNFLVPLRAGFFRDGQPVFKKVTDPVSGVTRDEKVAFNGLTFGIGVDVDGKLIDFAYVREGGRVSRDVDGQDRDVRYQRFLVSLIVRFGERR